MTDSSLIKQYAIRLGDDSLILGHRLSEWCSRGPFLEEDLALTNTALDYVGRARMFFSYAAEIAGDGSTEDTYAYLRDCRDFTNLLILELPNGDFAFSMARQYLVDEFNMLFMSALAESSDETLKGVAQKAIKEGEYHLRRSREWVLRLGDGTEESQGRMQKAVNDLWGYTNEFFLVDDLERSLVEAGIAPDTAALEPAWRERVEATLAEATLDTPPGDWTVVGGREGVHTEALGHLLSDLQFIQKSYPGLQW